MLTFLVSGTHVGCYVTEGLGHVNVPCKWHTCWMLRY